MWLALTRIRTFIDDDKTLPTEARNQQLNNKNDQFKNRIDQLHYPITFAIALNNRSVETTHLGHFKIDDDKTCRRLNEIASPDEEIEVLHPLTMIKSCQNEGGIMVTREV